MGVTGPSRRWLQVTAGVGLSALFLFLALRGEDLEAVAESLEAADPRYLAAMAGIGVYALYVRCQRWRLLLERPASGRLPMLPLFSAAAIGFMANMVLPLRVGEFARPYLVSRNTSVSLSAALASIILERILDLAALFVFAMWVVSAAEVPAVVVRLAWIAGGVVACLLAGLLVLHAQRARLLPVIDGVWLRLPARIGSRIVRVEHEFLDALAVLGDLSVFGRAALWSLYLWLVIAVGFSVGFPAVGIDVPFLSGGVAVTTIVALAVSIPSAPAFVGQFEWGCKVALVRIYGVSGALALGYSLFTHALQFSVQVILGVVFLVREGLSLGELGQLDAREAEGGSASK
ncbi:MAG: UPF0104 family protein [Candidatus Dadabacteria bacterium]|nr:MAG: UPF0104 family protein [Candidatus Dadabacteria bacterium]